MKVFIVLSAVIALAVATGYHGYGHNEGHGYGHAVVLPTKSIHVAPVHTGYSNSYRQQDSWGNYKFGYNEQHHDGGSSRDESGDSWGNKVGSYSLNVGDGRKRVVKYVADGHGFRASIQTNEPGIVAKAPADVSIVTPHGHGYGSDNHGYGSDNHGYGHGLDHGYGSHQATVTHVGGYSHPIAHGYGHGHY